MNRPLNASTRAALISKNNATRIAKLGREHARELELIATADARIVTDWQARFNMARNAACAPQKNFAGIR